MNLMNEIVISKNITSNKLNDLYGKLKCLNSSKTILIIPGHLTKYRFGLLADILRFVITLNHKTKIHTLKINLQKDKLETLYDQEYAYPLISLLWNTSIFVDQNNDNIKDLLRTNQNSFFVKMNSLSKIKGNKYILVNTDHLSRNNGLIKLLENSNGFNDDERQIKENIKKILSEYVLTFNKKNLSEIEEIIEDIGAIIFELVKNTYEWGKTDSNFMDFPSSIRGVYLRFHKNKNNKLIEEYRNTPIANFFRDPNLIRNSLNEQQQIYYLEILVFDSGIGYIDKFNSKEDLSDIDIIKNCLIKNQTSSESNLKSKKGIGLDRILYILNKKGFLRISTDKYRVYRDLIKDEYKPINNNNLDELVLMDWNKNNFKTEKSVKFQGSYINILYPFKSTS